MFVAPTKPLVAQQFNARNKMCGLPGRAAIALTGDNLKPTRAKAVRDMISLVLAH